MKQTLDENIGRQIGRFRLLGLLGSGGFASVYRAEDTELGRQVAIKLLHSTLARDDAFVRRFRAEARAAAGLRHPNIVSIYEVGTTQDGQTYLVMELLQGTLLSQPLRGQKPLAPAQATRIISQLASALDHLHSRGLVHRDLKPSNVMLDERGDATLLDFGIARTLEDEGHLTQTGHMIGSPVYMAPEQITGGTITAAADIYALGVLAYELFAGRPPFLGTPTGIIHDQIYTPPPPIDEINPHVPARVVRAINQALAKDPKERPAMAGGFAGLLAGTAPTESTAADSTTATAILATSGPAAAPIPSPISPPTPRNRYRIPAIIGGVVVLLLAAGLGALLLTSKGGASSQPKQVVAQRAAPATPAAVAPAAAASPQVSPSASPSPSASAPPAASPVPAVAASATATSIPATGLPANVTVVADDNASASAVAPAQQGVAQLLQQFAKDYGLVANRPFQIQLASDPQATKTHLMSDLGLTAAAADAFFQPNVSYQFNNVGASVRVLMYLPNILDLQGSLAYAVADYTLRSVGRGFEQTDAYPYWFLRGFLGYASVRFGTMGDSYRPRAVADAKAGKAPSLAATSKSSDAMAFMGASSANSATFLAWSEAADAYIAKTFGEASLGRLISDNAFGTIDKFNQLLQSVTGITLDQFNSAVIASLTQ